MAEGAVYPAHGLGCLADMTPRYGVDGLDKSRGVCYNIYNGAMLGLGDNITVY